MSTGRAFPTSVAAPVLLESLKITGRVRPTLVIHRVQALLPKPPAGRKPAGPPDMTALGTGLLAHCAVEMNHLASFLPALHEEFRGTV